MALFIFVAYVSSVISTAQKKMGLETNYIDYAPGLTTLEDIMAECTANNKRCTYEFVEGRFDTGDQCSTATCSHFDAPDDFIHEYKNTFSEHNRNRYEIRNVANV